MAFGYPLVVAAAVFGLATYCACHLVIAQLWRTCSPYRPLVGGFLPGLIITGATTASGLVSMRAGFQDCCGYAVLNLLTYGALGWGYFHFVNLCIASLRIRVLEELVEKGGTATAEFLFLRYNDDRVTETRLDRLIRGRHLVFRDGRFMTGKKQFLHVARLFETLRWLVLGTKATRSAAFPSESSPSVPPAGREGLVP